MRLLVAVVFGNDLPFQRNRLESLPVDGVARNERKERQMVGVLTIGVVVVVLVIIISKATKRSGTQTKSSATDYYDPNYHSANCECPKCREDPGWYIRAKRANDSH